MKYNINNIIMYNLLRNRKKNTSDDILSDISYEMLPLNDNNENLTNYIVVKCP
jgi:hypothetical protein